MGQISTLYLCAMCSVALANHALLPEVLQYREKVSTWLREYNRNLAWFDRQAASFAWNMTTKMNVETVKNLKEFETWRSKWNDMKCEEVRIINPKYLGPDQQRMLSLMCRGPILTPEQMKQVFELLTKLELIYNTAKVEVNGTTYVGETETMRVMVNSRDYGTLLETWLVWRNAVGPPSRPLYSQLVETLNRGAQANGYRDLGEAWREELRMENLEQSVFAFYEQIRPLYEELHAFVRGHLVRLYGPHMVDPDGPLPAHLLGNMWAQNWEPLLWSILPPKYLDNIYLGAALRRNGYNVTDIVALAEDFYISMGFAPLPTKFWTKSQFVKQPGNPNGSCHGSAADMFDMDDFRILICAEVNEEDFYTIHHEMGHIQYYRAYQHQPQLFRLGANSAFHEAVGDSILYSILSPSHRARLGFYRIDADHPPIAPEFFLLRQALAKIPLLPFSLLVDKWRWDVFKGNVTPDDYNKAWWELRHNLQGVQPPVPRSEHDFDPASKYHVPDNTPYIRYFLSGILQLQFFKGLCQAAGYNSPGSALHECDLYGSKTAGTKLRAMMSLGASRSWQDALYVITGQREISTAPLLEYYAPLYKWLVKENKRHNWHIGWMKRS